MTPQRIYVGGWFQRTSLHLSEIQDFLASGTSELALDPVKLTELRAQLDIREVTRHLQALESLIIETKDLSVRIYEDGLVVLSTDGTKTGTAETDIKRLTDYYEQKLSPAFSYLFSLGAPVPKELANIKTVYPYFVVLNNASHEEITALLARFGETKRLEKPEVGFEMFRGSKLHIINNKSESLDDIERLIEEQIFLREFKTQLHRYLNLHRIIWERIAQVKERGSIDGKSIGEFKGKLEGYAKTINLIEARISQMGAYLHTRERIAAADPRLKPFESLLDYRYETLGDSLQYIRDIWTMTKNYIASAKDLFNSLDAQATQNSVRNLTVVTSMGVGATLIGLFTAAAPKFTSFGIWYFIILTAVGYAADRLTRWFYRHKVYPISSPDYDKNIA